MKKEVANNNGFSLVELIIVIAIMAILVGILAPNVLRQLEKAKVSNDLETLSTICASIEYGLTDQAIMNDPASQALANYIDTTTTPIPITIFSQPTYASCELVNYIKEASKIGDFTQNGIMDRIKSRTTANSMVYFCRRGTAINPIVMWITETDSEGKRRKPSAPTTYEGITCEIAIN
ncbi:MAG: prepilin-type N-terminal cleavage/methylation domain-containing protein [Lachnospiraceae bacterium]|nr:prepilin-type N-terminal cleavage/methylation domain-containing protein [Lachnospiraceae bacterium]